MGKRQVLSLLKQRLEQNSFTDKSLRWEDVVPLLNEQVINTLVQMEQSGGQIHLVHFDKRLLVVDMFKESPTERVSLCYDYEARMGRKSAAPSSSALEEALKMGSLLVDETLYYHLQTLTDLDLKTSTWLLTQAEVRKQGGAIFGDKRYGRTFIYHNGADSYYRVRGFRTFIEL